MIIIRSVEMWKTRILPCDNHYVIRLRQLRSSAFLQHELSLLLSLPIRHRVFGRLSVVFQSCFLRTRVRSFCGTIAFPDNLSRVRAVALKRFGANRAPGMFHVKHSGRGTAAGVDLRDLRSVPRSLLFPSAFAFREDAFVEYGAVRSRG